MKTTVSRDTRYHKNERGAALITTLLISALLLAAGGTLILTTSMSATNTVDAAAEMQAYYGAEAGLQATLDVMRGNVLPNPLFVANPVGDVAPENRIDFTKALDPAKSNLAGDPTTSGFPKRLSRWLSYNYTPTGLTYADRLGISPAYNPFSGVAYDVQLTDPDNTNLATAKPVRIIVKSTGYGPRGASKTLSMMLSANGLNIGVPAALVLRGHDNATTNVTIDLGNSNAKTYSGLDNAGLQPAKPALAISGHDVTTVQAAYASKPGTVSDPKFNVLDLPNDPAPAGTTTVPTPWFLQTADNARAFLVQAEALANSCAAPGTPCHKRGVVVNSLSGSAGTTAAPQFTIVKGDCHLDSGAGLLIVTGALTTNGNPSFTGLILVLGQGSVIKSGGGNGDTLGAMMIARFGSTGGFLDPTFLVSGGGTSNLQYDSRNSLDAVIMSGAAVLGIAEK